MEDINVGKKGKIHYYQYERCDPERVIADAAFQNGVIVYQKTLSTAAKINLAKSYMLLTLEVGADAGFESGLDATDEVAPVFMAPNTMFKSIYYKINNQIVSSVTNHVGEICACRHRLSMTASKRDRYLGLTHMGEPYFEDRLKYFSKDDNTPLGKTQWEVCKPRLAEVTVDIIGNVEDVAVGGAVQANAGRVTFDNLLADDDVRNFLDIGDKLRLDGVEYTIESYGAGVDTVLVNPPPKEDIDETADWQRVRRRPNHRQRRRINIMFRPPLGIFDKDEWILGHQLHLEFNPYSDSQWKKFFFETCNGNEIQPDDDYYCRVLGMEFYPLIGYIEHSVESATQEISFTETRLQLQNITSNVSLDRTFVIDKRSRAITLAIQADKAQTGSSQFPKTRFIAQPNDQNISAHLDLKEYLVQFETYQWPRPQHDLQYDNFQDRLLQPYIENLTYQKLTCDKYHDPESYDEYLYLGPIYHWLLPREPNRSNPKLSVKTRFRDVFNINERPNLMLFDHYNRSFMLRAKNGRVIEVKPSPHAA